MVDNIVDSSANFSLYTYKTWNLMYGISVIIGIIFQDTGIPAKREEKCIITIILFIVANHWTENCTYLAAVCLCL